VLPKLIGMIHLAALPGAPHYGGDFAAVIDDAVADARSLETAGFDGLMIENFGDVPFFADEVPKATVAAMTYAVGRVGDAVSLPFGVNVLRNDAAAALAVAAATGADFIRVNVLSGIMYTDQGPIVGRAAEIARMRAALAPDVAIMADVFVKHAAPPPGLTIEQAAEELAGRALADAIVVSGTSTGRPPTLPFVRKVTRAVPDTAVFLGSGVTAASASGFLGVATGVIAGTSLKKGGVTTNPVDPKRAAAFVKATRAAS
jgi:membrane complex biogenesis BtpA family protein